MSAAMRLSSIAKIVATVAAVGGLSTVPAVRDFLSRYLGSTSLKYSWRVLLVVIAVANLKNLPGFWHIRVLRGIIYQLYFQPTVQKPRYLFAPLITSSFNTPYDCDYNIHKSNSTYFADLDVARAHLVSCIIREGLARLNRGDEEGLSKGTREGGGKYFIALGGVACFFQRQIEPLQSFEIFSRVLAWDRKWLYCVSHIVKKGVVKPDSYVLQPWRRSHKKPSELKKDDEDLSKHIFATSIARYVFKKDRLTINPEIVLERSRLLPPRPDGVGLPPRSESADVTPAETPATPAGASTPGAIASEVSEKLGKVAHAAEADDEWTWDDMEKERLRGLNIASHFESLSAVNGELRAGDVLGRFGDYW